MTGISEGRISAERARASAASAPGMHRFAFGAALSLAACVARPSPSVSPESNAAQPAPALENRFAPSSAAAEISREPLSSSGREALEEPFSRAPPRTGAQFAQPAFDKAEESMHTVRGPIALSTLGVTLTHEHIMSNFGKPQSEASLYNEQRLLQQVVPYLKGLKARGVRTVLDCTTQYFGRRVDLLRRISAASGVQIVTNTGIYGAAKDRYIPQFAFSEDAESIAELWAREFSDGIGSSGIKPGFIKLGFDEGPPSEIDTKLFVAGLLAHRKTGLKLAVHTGDNLQAASLQRSLLHEHGISAKAWVWVHAHKVADTRLLLAAAAEGAWISLDGVSASNTHATLARLRAFRSQQLLHKVLLSHDGNAFPAGRQIRPFDAIFENLIPELIKNGFSQSECNGILIDNPRRAFAIKRQPLRTSRRGRAEWAEPNRSGDRSQPTR